MNDLAREEAAALWLKIIHTYEDEPVRGDAAQTRADIIDRLAAMIRSLARIEAALALHEQESFAERDEVTGKDLWETGCPICKTRQTCDTVKALRGEE